LFFHLGHIKQKLYAIKPSHDLNKPIEKIENVIYDVYYPDNDVPKKSRPAPDYRVIVIEYENSNYIILIIHITYII
jgi:hypothetical protein